MTLREWIVSKEVRDVKRAQWEGYRRLAMRLPDHHILSVELIRTRHDETAAVFTVVRNGEPVQQVVFADAKGRVFPNQGRPRHCGDGGKPRQVVDAQAEGPRALGAQAELEAVPPMDGGDGSADPDSVALGQPPIKEPPSAAVLAIASSVMPGVFDVGELAVGANA